VIVLRMTMTTITTMILRRNRRKRLRRNRRKRLMRDRRKRLRRNRKKKLMRDRKKRSRMNRRRKLKRNKKKKLKRNKRTKSRMNKRKKSKRNRMMTRSLSIAIVSVTPTISLVGKLVTCVWIQSLVMMKKVKTKSKHLSQRVSTVKMFATVTLKK